MCRHGKSCRLNKGSWGDEGGRLWPPMRTVLRERFKGVDNCWWWLPFLDVRVEWYGSYRRQKPDNLSRPLYAKIKPETLFYHALIGLARQFWKIHNWNMTMVVPTTWPCSTSSFIHKVHTFNSLLLSLLLNFRAFTLIVPLPFLFVFISSWTTVLWVAP